MNTEQVDTDNLPQLNLDAIDKTLPIAKIIELRNKGLTYKEIGIIIGCSKQAIHQRLKPFLPSIDNLKTAKEQRADTLHVINDTLLNSLTASDINSMAPLQKITGFGILYDKERLERGQSTANIAYSDHSRKLEELDKEIQELEAELGLEGESG